MDIKTIDYLASLARLEIDDSEKESVARDLAGVLAYVDQIQAVAKNLGNIEPEYLKTNTTSSDHVLNMGGQYTQAILNETPNHEGDYVVVKKVL